MSEQLIPWAAWAGLVLLAVLCLPIGGCQKFVLGVSAWALRLALLAVLAGGAYLYFRPGEMPARVSNVLNDFPGVLSVLPDRAAPHFGLCLACLIAAPLLPLLMVLDVTRAVAGRRLNRLCAIADGRPDVVTVESARRTVVETVPNPAPPLAPPVVDATPVMRPIDRRTASTTIASSGRSHIPVAPVGR
jgi:hypothetical protein